MGNHCYQYQEFALLSLQRQHILPPGALTPLVCTQGWDGAGVGIDCGSQWLTVTPCCCACCTPAGRGLLLSGTIPCCQELDSTLPCCQKLILFEFQLHQHCPIPCVWIAPALPCCPGLGFELRQHSPITGV